MRSMPQEPPYYWWSNTNLVLQAAHRAILQTGRIVIEGDAKELWMGRLKILPRWIAKDFVKFNYL